MKKTGTFLIPKTPYAKMAKHSHDYFGKEFDDQYANACNQAEMVRLRITENTSQRIMEKNVKSFI